MLHYAYGGSYLHQGKVSTFSIQPIHHLSTNTPQKPTSSVITAPVIYTPEKSNNSSKQITVLHGTPNDIPRAGDLNYLLNLPFITICYLKYLTKSNFVLTFNQDESKLTNSIVLKHC